MANSSPEESQSEACRILRVFNDSPQNEHLRHRCVWVWLHGPDAPVRLEMEKLISGTPLSAEELPLLFEIVTGLFFMPVVERFVESLHALLNRVLHHSKVSGPCASLVLRAPFALERTKDPEKQEKWYQVQSRTACVSYCLQ